MKSPDSPSPPRLLSLDAYRGFIMLLMASAGFELTRVSRLPQHLDSKLWQFIGYECDHADWVGCSLWDLIQPAFMFMVGVALTLSVANRRARGEGIGWTFVHALWRSLLLVLIAVFLSSSGKQTNWIFTNVLAQIGLAYPFLFLISFAPPRVQWFAAFGILAAYWLAFALYPLAPEGFNWKSAGVPDTWPHLKGFEAHWEKNANIAARFDQWFLNLFPRESRFEFSNGGYQTLNFVSSLATMIFGLRAGGLLRGDLPMPDKVLRLCFAGTVALFIGDAIALAGLCPNVKRIWTPTFALHSGGCVVLILAGFVALIEWVGWKKWALPLVVVGLNPITMYCLFQTMGGYLKDNVRRHLGEHVFGMFGTDYTKSMERAVVLAILWLIVFWMYRRKIVLRI